MRNKILIALSMLAGIAFAASSFTTHYNLEKSADGDTNWGSAYRSNMDTIDTQIYSASQTADNHIADTTGAHAATAISATSGSLVCLTEVNVQDYLDCLDGQLGAITGGTVVTTNTVQTITASKTFSALQTFTSGLTLTGGALTLPFSTGLLHSDGSGVITSSLLVNADVDAAAGITYSKLSLTDGIVDADVNSAAAIAYSKLNLATSITSADIVDGTIVNDDINASAAIVDTKLATISTSGKVSNSATTATAANTASAIVARDSDGNASATNFISATTANTGSGTITLTKSSARTQTFSAGGGGFSVVLPDATTLRNGSVYELNHNSTGTMTVKYNDASTIDTFGAGSDVRLILSSNSTSNGVWDYHSWIPQTAKYDTAGLAVTGTISSSSTIGLIETGGGTDQVKFAGPASTTGYTITLPGSAPTANTALAYDGANYVWSSAGGWTTYANENISGSGSVTTSTTVGQQVRRVTGNGAAVTLSTTPFGAVGGWSDGLVVRLIGQSSSNTVTVVHNDAANGAILNGDCTLGAYDVIELQWDSTASRWIEIARSIK